MIGILNKLILKTKNKLLISKYKITKTLKKGDATVIMMLLIATIGAIAVIGFFLVTKNGTAAWGESFKNLVQM